jgi:hypothetical protein
MKDGISSPTHLVGLRRFIALLTSAAEIRAADKMNSKYQTRCITMNLTWCTKATAVLLVP